MNIYSSINQHEINSMGVGGRKFTESKNENRKLYNNSLRNSSNNTKNIDMELQIPDIDPFVEQQIKDNENNYDCQSMCTNYDYNTNTNYKNTDNDFNFGYKNNNNNENEKDLILNSNSFSNINSGNLKEIINNQRQTILNLATKYKKIEYVLFTLKNEKEKEKENNFNKNRERELINKELEEKILMYENKIKNLNKEFEEYKIKSFEDFSYKEKKLLDLINKINDLEDENYRIIHCNKDVDKKKFLLMEKKTKELTMDFQKVKI